MMPYNSQQEYQPEYERRKSYPEIVINNILLSVVCIFLIVLGFFSTILIITSINNQTSVDYTTFDKSFETDASNYLGVGIGVKIYITNPLLSTFNIEQYRTGALIWSTTNPADYIYTTTDASITINSPTWLAGDVYRVQANTDYQEPPAESVLTAIAVGLIIMALMAFFGIVGYKYINR